MMRLFLVTEVLSLVFDQILLLLELILQVDKIHFLTLHLEQAFLILMILQLLLEYPQVYMEILFILLLEYFLKTIFISLFGLDIFQV